MTSTSSSLVEGDEELDQPNSQTCMELYHVWIAYYVWIFNKHNSLPLGPMQLSSPSTKDLHDHYVLSLDNPGVAGARKRPRPDLPRPRDSGSERHWL